MISAKQWAQALGVKLPTPDPNAMDTRADRTCYYFRNKGSNGCAGTTKEDPVKQCQEGRCFTCNKQGHLARNCPDKPSKDKGKVKARTAETEVSDDETITETRDNGSDFDAFIRKGRSMKDEINSLSSKWQWRQKNGLKV